MQKSRAINDFKKNAFSIGRYLLDFSYIFLKIQKSHFIGQISQFPDSVSTLATLVFPGLLSMLPKPDSGFPLTFPPKLFFLIFP